MRCQPLPAALTVHSGPEVGAQCGKPNYARRSQLSSYEATIPCHIRLLHSFTDVDVPATHWRRQKSNFLRSSVTSPPPLRGCGLLSRRHMMASIPLPFNQGVEATGDAGEAGSKETTTNSDGSGG